MSEQHPSLPLFQQRQEQTLDAAREEAVEKRRAKGYRTARENVAALCDEGTFLEYGQMAVAAQRQRRELDDLRSNTAADGVITGIGQVNADLLGDEAACGAAIVVNDYSVLAGTQGFFHHKKLDRIFQVAAEQSLPVVMYAEGGGGRPGDVDVKTSIAGLNIDTFARWAQLSGQVPRIAVANGYCFAGNAALFGCADITIATESSWIGMAGPAMVEGGGLGSFKPTDIGPSAEQYKNGVIDLLAKDEAHAAELARQLLAYFQGPTTDWVAADQDPLRSSLPLDRRFSYKVRDIITVLFDQGSFLELRQPYGGAVITGFARLEGKPVGVLASDCRVMGGAIDSPAAEKTARFMQLCDAFGLSVVSLGDTPGFMVGPDHEQQAAVRRLSRLFVSAASLRVPIVGVFLRKGYGLGAMALMGGSFSTPVYCASWPTGEFGGMGLEGAVKLGFRKELEAAESDEAREALFEQLVGMAYEQGRATEAASFLELDAVIDPADTRAMIIGALAAAKVPTGFRGMVDTY